MTSTPTHALVEDTDTDVINIRAATTDDGLFIEALILSSGYAPRKVRWINVEPGVWFVIVFENQAVGALQLRGGVPLGQIEFIAAIPEVSGPLKILLLQHLYGFARGALENEGTECILCIVPDSETDLMRVLAGQGGKAICHATVMAMTFPSEGQTGHA